MTEPETRASLLLRCRDPKDRQAWEEFVSLYHPVLLQMAKRRGMQAADAEDLAQQVLVAISEAIDRFDPDDERAQFRTWLKTIARNAIINSMTRQRRDRAIGGSDLLDLLHEQPRAGAETETIHWEYRREVFQTAASQIRDEFQPRTWQLFWETVVEGVDVDTLASRMKCSRGSIYTARSRVITRLKQKVQQLDRGADA